LAAIDNAEAVSVGSSSVPGPTSEHIAGATSRAGSSDEEQRVLSAANGRAIVGKEIEQARGLGLTRSLGIALRAARLAGEGARGVALVASW
jgi:hypothetical protein